MKKILLSLMVLSLALLSVGCLVKKTYPQTGRIDADYNQRINVSGAYFKKEITFFGRALKVISVGGGALMAENMKITNNFTSNGTQNSITPINIGIGAITGFGISTWANHIGGQNKIIEIKNEQQRQNWIQKLKYDKEYKILDEISISSFRLIHIRADENFTVRQIEDVRDFVKAFPQSSYAPSIVEQSLNKLRREYLPEASELLSGVASSENLKKAYVEQSSNFEQSIEAKNKYPQYKEKAEELAYSYVNSTESAFVFANEFPNSTLGNEVFCKTYLYADKETIVRLVSTFPNSTCEKNAKLRYIAISKTLDDFLVSLDKYALPELEIRKDINLASVDDLNYLKQKIYAFKAVLPTSYANNWVQEIDNKVNDQNNLALKKQRQDEFYTAKQSGLESIIAFAQKYPNTDESIQAGKEIDNFVAQNLVYERESTGCFVANGDRNFMNDFYENNRDLFSGGDNFNVFIFGIVNNKSNTNLRVKLDVGLNVIRTRAATILARSVTNDTNWQNYYLDLQPNEKLPFICVYKNALGGGYVGSGLLTVGGSTILNENDKFQIKPTYYSGTISEDVKNNQKKLLDMFMNKKNITTTKSGNDALGDFGNYLSGTNSVLSTITIYYQKTTESTEKIRCLDNNNREINYREVSGKTKHTIVFNSLQASNTYTIVVPNKGTYKITLANGRIEHFQLDDNGIKSIYTDK